MTLGTACETLAKFKRYFLSPNVGPTATEAYSPMISKVWYAPPGGEKVSRDEQQESAAAFLKQGEGRQGSFPFILQQLIRGLNGVPSGLSCSFRKESYSSLTANPSLWRPGGETRVVKL